MPPFSMDVSKGITSVKASLELNSFCASPKQDNLHRLEHDQEIQPDGRILDIKQVVLKLLARVLKSIAVLILNLRPSCNTGAHDMAQVVIRNLPAQPLHEFRTFRTWAYEVHISFEHTPQLRNLIQAQKSKILADFGNARIVVGSPGCAGISFSVLPHCPKFVTVEGQAAAPHPFLPVENGTRGTQLHRQGH